MAGRYWVETLGCPKNQVDSDKLEGTLVADGLLPAHSANDADVVVVNTCAFIESARQESVDRVLALSDLKKTGARLVVTGCMAERYGDELADALPEADMVAGFGVPVSIGRKAEPGHVPLLDLLNLPRPKSSSPWAYVKVAEGCDRTCGFCAIPSFRGPQRSRTPESILAEVDALEAKEIVLVAQDLASYGRDREDLGAGSIVALVAAVAERVQRVRLLYLYPSDLTDGLVSAIEATGVHYFDLSLQHVSKAHLRRMRRWGDGDRFLRRIDEIRTRMPEAAFRSNFIVGYPGETEADHDHLLSWVAAAQLDWCGFCTYSREEGTHAADLPDQIDPSLMRDRLAELSELQDGITAVRRAALVGTVMNVLVDAPGMARSHREAPEIDGIISVPTSLFPGSFVDVTITGVEGPDLEAVPVAGLVSVGGRIVESAGAGAPGAG
ncbi:MAG: 30S ribosomal protein S12 methylthiotransferase RimO [Acidimicrobiales bacterium]